MQIYSCMISGDPRIESSNESLSAISGLSLDIPSTSIPGMDDSSLNAVAMFNAGAPYAKGTKFPGISFAIYCNDFQIGQGGFSSAAEAPQDWARTPVTLLVPLTINSAVQTRIEVRWQAIRGSVGVIDSVASLTVVVA